MSKIQEYVLSLLQKILKETPIQVEVPVQKLFPEYISGRERYDIVVKSMRLIVEVHGQQHGEIVSFGNEDKSDSYRRLVWQKHRDTKKMEVACQNSWSYAIIWYHELKGREDADLETLRGLILKAIEETPFDQASKEDQSRRPH